MPCFHPMEAWRSNEQTKNGKSRIVFKKPQHALVPIQLPCGQCIGCKLQRSLMWAIRCVHESQLHTENSFLTLTYNDENLPQYGSLEKSHIPKFIRSLRKKHPGKTIRYFMCGEYGEQLKRPHYHICLFGHNFPDREIFLENEGILTYTSKTLEEQWQKGFCTIGELNFDTAAYTARYITKKINGEMGKYHYDYGDLETGELITTLQKEFTTMSRRPGIAADWYSRYKNEVFPSDYLIYKNRKINVPRFYDNLYEIEGNDIEAIKIQRKKKGYKFRENNTPERLRVREKIKQLKFDKLNRSYETS